MQIDNIIFCRRTIICRVPQGNCSQANQLVRLFPCKPCHNYVKSAVVLNFTEQIETERIIRRNKDELINRMRKTGVTEVQSKILTSLETTGGISISLSAE